MEPNAPSYIVREADAQLLDALLAGEYVFLLDSRQKGKSSLVARTMLGLKEAGVTPIKLDLQRIGANVSPEQWYAGLLAGIGQELGLDSELFAYWEAHPAIGPLARWLGALEAVVLPKTEKPLVIFIDEIDFVRALPFTTDEFFAGIRDCFNRRSDVPAYKRLTFCLVGVATPGQLIRNPDITPFNVGQRIELTDFSEVDLAPFAAALSGNGRDGAAMVAKVYSWVRGHPYLTQLLCSHLAANSGDVDGLVKRLLLGPDARQREPNLADVERRMLDPDIPGLEEAERRIQVLELYRQLLKGRGVAADFENPVTDTLKLSGISREEGGKLALRNRLYETIFSEAWIQASLPDAEKRRQRKAARAAALKVASISAVLIAAITGVATYTWNLSVERSRAVRESRSIASNAERRAYNSSMYLLSDQAGRGNWLRAVELLDKTKTSPAKGWEWQFWNARLNGQLRSMKSPPGFGFLTYLRDGSTYGVVTTNQLQLGTGQIIEVGPVPVSKGSWFQNKVRNWDTASLESGTPRMTPAPVPVASRILAVSQDGRLIADLDAAKEVVVVRRADGVTIWSKRGLPMRRHLSGAFSPDGKLFALALATVRPVFLLDSATGAIQRTLVAGGANNPRFSPNGRFVAVPTNDFGTLVFDSRTGAKLLGLASNKVPTSCAEFSEDGRLIATSGYDGTIRLWSMPGGRLLSVLPGHRSAVHNLAFSPNGQVLVSRAQDGEVREWSLAKLSSVETLRIHKGEVVRLELSPDATRMATSSMDGTVVLYDVPRRRVLRRIEAGPIERAHAIAFSNDGALLAVSLPGGAVGLYDAKSGAERLVLRGHSQQVKRVQFCDGDRKLLTVSDDGTAKVWGLGDGSELARYNPAEGVAEAAIDRSGRYVALALKNFTVQLHDLKAVSLVANWQVHRARIYAIEFSPDGKTIATTSYDESASLLPVSGGAPKTLNGHMGRMWEAQFSADGTKLLTNSYDGTARLWNVRTGRPIAVMRHDSWVAWAEFSPDGSRVITGAADNTIRLWDAETGDELSALRGHSAPVFRARMSRDQKFIASASSDGTVRLWPTLPSKD